MKELSLHILDLVQNSIHAYANLIQITITETQANNMLLICLEDNGCGMGPQAIDNVLNPFYTTKNKKTGLGIPLLKQHAELAGGTIEISSQVDVGTRLTATFGLDNIDRQPMGDLTGTLVNLIRANPEINFDYEHRVDDKKFNFSTREIKEEIDGIAINTPEILKFIKELISENLQDIGHRG